MKVWKVIGASVLSLAFTAAILLFDIKDLPAGCSIAGVILGLILPDLWHFIQDLWDTTNWKSSQRKLKRGGFIKDDTIIRISFAYLYRIKVGNKYLLVKNSRNTGKYQPVGGVYKLQREEKLELKNLYHVMDDDKIHIDKSSQNDYRLRMENRYLRKFMSRFDSQMAKRERIENVGREFKEELIETRILNWDKISYRYCGRFMTDLKFGEHFQIYELLLADIVELIPTVEQECDLKILMSKESNDYCFVTAEKIKSLGTDIEAEDLNERIGDHTRKILQEEEGQLIKMPGTGDVYTIEL